MFKRLYHSSSHVNTNLIINPKTIESKILNNAIKLIPSYGFSKQCINESIRQLNYSDSLQSLISWNGSSYEFQLMIHWLKQQRQALETKAKQDVENEEDNLDFFSKVSKLIKFRLLQNEPIVGKLSQGMSQLILPYNLNQSMEELYNLSDDLAFYSGDQSNDFNWYSKRFSIASIYIQCELYMLQDKSESFKMTQDFVDVKINEFRKLSDTYNNVEQWTMFNGISLINLIKSQLIRG